jgi:hypothetical protein
MGATEIWRSNDSLGVSMEMPGFDSFSTFNVSGGPLQIPEEFTG